VFGYSQTTSIETIPKEELIINTNTELLVSGETLYYNVHCFEKESNSLSTISKIAYLFLINDSKKIVFTHKIKLIGGLGKGEYYIPSNLGTGNYKLVGYTNWMRNNKNPFFQLDLYIVNPFNKNRNRNLSKIDSIGIKSSSTLLLEKESSKNQSQNKYTYKTRSKVSIDLKELGINSFNKNYTISVRKKDSVQVYKSKTLSITSTQQKNPFYLPEIKGEIISGKVVLKETNTPTPNIFLALSIEGNPTIYKNAKTNKLGEFFFSLYENYNTNNLIIQINEDTDKYKIVLDDYSFSYMDQLQFNQLHLLKNTQNWLLNKSKSNQIESAFYESKKDSILKHEKPKMFYGKPSIVYELDKYTRFPTIKDFFVEVMTFASIKKRKGVQKIRIFTAETQLDKQIKDLNSLVLIDGVLIKNHELVLDINPLLIDRIEIVFDNYFLGPKIYDGIIHLRTKDKNFSFNTKSSDYKKKIVSPLKDKDYYYPDYSNNTPDLKRIPDFRTQLYWKPHTNINKLEFYTSDIKGVYEIVLSGYSKQKDFIKKTQYIKVE